MNFSNRNSIAALHVIAAVLTGAMISSCGGQKPLPPSTIAAPVTVTIVSLVGPGFHLAKHGLTAFEVSRDICPPPFDVDGLIRDVAGQKLTASGRYRYVPVTYDPGALDGVRNRLRAAAGTYVDMKLANRQPLDLLRPLGHATDASLVVVFTDYITKAHMNFDLWGMGLYKDSLLGMITATRTLYVNLAATVIDTNTLEILRQDARQVGAPIEEDLWLASCSAQTQDHRSRVTSVLDGVLRKEVPESLSKVGLL